MRILWTATWKPSIFEIWTSLTGMPEKGRHRFGFVQDSEHEAKDAESVLELVRQRLCLLRALAQHRRPWRQPLLEHVHKRWVQLTNVCTLYLLNEPHIRRHGQFCHFCSSGIVISSAHFLLSPFFPKSHFDTMGHIQLKLFLTSRTWVKRFHWVDPRSQMERSESTPYIYLVTILVSKFL